MRCLRLKQAKRIWPIECRKSDHGLNTRLNFCPRNGPRILGTAVKMIGNWIATRLSVMSCRRCYIGKSMSKWYHSDVAFEGDIDGMCNVTVVLRRSCLEMTESLTSFSLLYLPGITLCSYKFLLFTCEKFSRAFWMAYPSSWKIYWPWYSCSFIQNI